MDKQKLQPFLDKMKIISKDECTKWDMNRWHYIIKIGDEVFNYYGSAKEFEDEKKIIEHADKRMISKLDARKELGINKLTDDEVKTDALYCLVNDYSYGDYDLADFLEGMGYDGERLREGIKIHKDIQINKQRMYNVFTRDEIELLTDLYSNY